MMSAGQGSPEAKLTDIFFDIIDHGAGERSRFLIDLIPIPRDL